MRVARVVSVRVVSQVRVRVERDVRRQQHHADVPPARAGAARPARAGPGAARRRQGPARLAHHHLQVTGSTETSL